LIVQHIQDYVRIITQSSIDISESLASFILGCHIENTVGCTCLFEKRLNNVDTGRFSIADAYIPEKNTAIEVKSVAHGSAALKGVLQSSIYKEEISNSIFCMQRPRRSELSNRIESMCAGFGVGCLWLDGIPTICDEDSINSATGGVSKPFQLWKRRSYNATKRNIVARSEGDYIAEYINTLEQIITEEKDKIFDFAVEPDPTCGGLSDIY